MKFYEGMTLDRISRLTWLQYLMLTIEAADIAKEESKPNG